MSRRATLISAPSQCGSKCRSRCEGSVSPPTPPGPGPTSLRSSLGQLFPASRGCTGSITPGLEVAGTGQHRPGKLAARPGVAPAQQNSSGPARQSSSGPGRAQAWTLPCKGGQAGESWGLLHPHLAASSCFLRMFIYIVMLICVTASPQHFFLLSAISWKWLTFPSPWLVPAQINPHCHSLLRPGTHILDKGLPYRGQGGDGTACVCGSSQEPPHQCCVTG